MRFQTSRFGEIEISDEKVLNFNDCIPGLEGLTMYTLITTEETEPFHWLQSLQDGNVALAVINPFQLFPDYNPLVPENILHYLDVKNDADVLILTVCVVPPDYKSMTTNLMSPLFINSANNQGCQIILETSDYALRQPIFEAIQALLIGGGADNAGSNA